MAQALLNAPDATTKKGLRNRAILTVLLGCGLRRSEGAVLTFKHIQQRDGRWCIVDLVGKHGARAQRCPCPGIPLRGGAIRDSALSEKVVWQLIRPYAEAAGVARGTLPRTRFWPISA